MQSLKLQIWNDVILDSDSEIEELDSQERPCFSRQSSNPSSTSTVNNNDEVVMIDDDDENSNEPDPPESAPDIVMNASLASNEDIPALEEVDEVPSLEKLPSPTMSSNSRWVVFCEYSYRVQQ